MSRRTKILSIEETLVEGESFFTVVKVIIDICLRITIYWIILEDHRYQDLHGGGDVGPDESGTMDPEE